MEIKIFENKDIDKASEVLAKRHKNERVYFHSLKEKFENKSYTKKILEKLLNEKNVIAICAYEKGEMLGYIVSHVRTDNVFGRYAWVKYEGIAISNTVDAELYRKMYAHIAQLWIDVGCLNHYVFVPAANEENVDAWLKSGFAFQQVYGIAKAEETNMSIPDNIKIRQAVESDENDLKSVSNLIMSYQAKSPTFAVGLPEEVIEIKRGYGGLAKDDEAIVLLAYEKNKLLGFQCIFKEDDDIGMMIPHNSYEIAVGGTVEESRGMGVGTLLVQEIINRALEAGCENLYTDWRMANLQSSNFWPKKGFKPVAYRMYRHIDERIYWADGIRTL